MINHLYAGCLQPCKECCIFFVSFRQHRLSHLPSCIRVGSSLQEELSHVHLPIFRGHMERSEAFLLKRKQNQERILLVLYIATFYTHYCH